MNLNDQGRYREAESLFRKALEISQRTVGEEHPDTATGYNELAYNLNAQGRYNEAEPMFQKALEIRQRTLGEGHPKTIQFKNDYEMFLSEQNSRLTEE